MNVSNIAYSSVNIIVKEVFDSYQKGVKFTVEKVKTKLSEAGVASEKILEVTEMIGESDPFEKAREELENERRRCRFINQNFPNVKPVTIVLNSEESAVKESY